MRVRVFNWPQGSGETDQAALSFFACIVPTKKPIQEELIHAVSTLFNGLPKFAIGIQDVEQSS